MAADLSAIGTTAQPLTGTAAGVATSGGGMAPVAGTLSPRPIAAASAATDVLQQAARQVVAAMPGRNQFSFNFDKSTGMTIVRVYNADTGELVRQIPSEEIVRIAQLMRQEEARPGVVDLTA
jgi:flagellar protein FlaG